MPLIQVSNFLFFNAETLQQTCTNLCSDECHCDIQGYIYTEISNVLKQAVASQELIRKTLLQLNREP